MLCFLVVRSRQRVCFCHVVMGRGGGGQKRGKKIKLFPPKSEFKDFILVKARLFYSSNGVPLGVKGLNSHLP